MSWVRFPAGTGKYFRSTKMAPTVNNPPYDRSVHKYLPWIHFHMIHVPRNSRTNFKLKGVIVTGSRYIYIYIIHFYCLAVEAGFYSVMVECLPVYPATWVRFPAGAGKILSLYDTIRPFALTN